MDGIFRCGTNALIKVHVDVRVVGLTDSPSAFLCWLVTGPEVSSVIEVFHDQQHITVGGCGVHINTHHHDMTKL